MRMLSLVPFPVMFPVTFPWEIAIPLVDRARPRSSTSWAAKPNGSLPLPAAKHVFA
jgi:hypothetical protein